MTNQKIPKNGYKIEVTIDLAWFFQSKNVKKQNHAQIKTWFVVDEESRVGFNKQKNPKAKEK